MYIFIRKHTKVRSVADAARRAKSGIGQMLRESHGFRSYYVLDGGEGVGVAVMIFEDRESANAANDERPGAAQEHCTGFNARAPGTAPGRLVSAGLQKHNAAQAEYDRSAASVSGTENHFPFAFISGGL